MPASVREYHSTDVVVELALRLAHVVPLSPVLEDLRRQGVRDDNVLLLEGIPARVFDYLHEKHDASVWNSTGNSKIRVPTQEAAKFALRTLIVAPFVEPDGRQRHRDKNPKAQFEYEDAWSPRRDDAAVVRAS